MRCNIRLAASALALWAGLACGNDASAARATWVAGGGGDTGTCTLTSPCASFAYAAAQTDAGGTINVLSSGSFGPVVITKTLAIVAEGAEALILGTASCPGAVNRIAAVCIRAGAADVVTLRGLHIDGEGGTGIAFLSAAALHIENTVIRDGSRGLSFTPRTESVLLMSDSSVSECFNSAILIEPIGSVSTRVTLDRVQSNNNNTGLTLNGNSGSGDVDAILRDSVVSGNGAGVYAINANTSGAVHLMIDRSAVVNNRAKAVSTASAGTAIYLGDSTVSGNATGLSPAEGGPILSFGTNKIIGNQVNGEPTEIVDPG